MDQEYTIMIVDDQEMILMILEKILKKSGYNVVACLSGEECLQNIYTVMPDLIILDLEMPGINGYETCAQLRDNPVTEETPIFFLSSMARDLQILNLTEDEGADEYLTKPINKEELLEKIQFTLSL